MPLTWVRYLNCQWTQELEAELPAELQDWSQFERKNCGRNTAADYFQ